MFKKKIDKDEDYNQTKDGFVLLLGRLISSFVLVTLAALIYLAIKTWFLQILVHGI
ncbi:MAG: hypothetical protein RR922_05875 [Clostridia bacterium]